MASEVKTGGKKNGNLPRLEVVYTNGARPNELPDSGVVVLYDWVSSHLSDNSRETTLSEPLQVSN